MSLKARSIETFWVCLAQKVYEESLKAFTEQQLILRIESKIKEFGTTFVKNLLEGVEEKVRYIGDNGNNSLWK